MLRAEQVSALVVDDDPDVVDFMTHVLTAADCHVVCASDGDQALLQAEASCPDVIFLDIHIPEQDGWLVCAKLKMLLSAPMIVLITGRTEGDTDRFAGFVHADEVLRKPFAEDDVLRIVKGLAKLST